MDCNASHDSGGGAAASTSATAAAPAAACNSLGLDDPLWLRIFGLLDECDQCAAAATCRHWRGIVEQLPTLPSLTVGIAEHVTAREALAALHSITVSKKHERLLGRLVRELALPGGDARIAGAEAVARRLRDMYRHQSRQLQRLTLLVGFAVASTDDVWRQLEQSLAGAPASVTQLELVPVGWRCPSVRWQDALEGLPLAARLPNLVRLSYREPLQEPQPFSWSHPPGYLRPTQIPALPRLAAFDGKLCVCDPKHLLCLERDLPSLRRVRSLLVDEGSRELAAAGVSDAQGAFLAYLAARRLVCASLAFKRTVLSSPEAAARVAALFDPEAAGFEHDPYDEPDLSFFLCRLPDSWPEGAFKGIHTLELITNPLDFIPWERAFAENRHLRGVRLLAAWLTSHDPLQNEDPAADPPLGAPYEQGSRELGALVRVVEALDEGARVSLGTREAWSLPGDLYPLVDALVASPTALLERKVTLEVGPQHQFLNAVLRPRRRAGAAAS
eukprot:tig00020816_g14198.t1